MFPYPKVTTVSDQLPGAWVKADVKLIESFKGNEILTACFLLLVLLVFIVVGYQ